MIQKVHSYAENGIIEPYNRKPQRCVTTLERDRTVRSCPMSTAYPFTDAFLKRFWARIQKSDGCWEWTGTRSNNGYGLCQPHGITHPREVVHRTMWRLQYGEIPDELLVCHHCDNRLCVRPDHLFLGTHEDNMADMTAKGRQANGERQPWSKLSEEQVREIWRQLSDGWSMIQVSRRFGVSERTIQFIKDGEHWTHVTHDLPPIPLNRKRWLRPHRKLSDNDIREIRKLYAAGMPRNELAQRFNVHRVTILRVAKYEVHGDVPDCCCQDRRG